MAVAAAGGCGGGSDGNGKPVKPHEEFVMLKGRKRKPKPRDVAENGGGDDGVQEVQQQTNGKRPRLVWTTELHDKFVRACKSLGRVVPKKILEAMKVNGLTRENVASHLQKYRKNLQERGQATRRRGHGGTVTMVQHTAPSLQAAPSPSLNPPPPTPPPAPPTPPQGSCAAPNIPQPQMGQVQIVQPLPTLVHRQPHPDIPILVPAPMPHLFYHQPLELQAAVEQRRRIIMEHQARHAAWMMNMQAAAVAPGHDHQMVAMNYELGAQAMARAPAAAAASGVQSHRLQPQMPSQAANMGGGLLCSVSEASMRDEQMETRMGMAQLQIAAEAEGSQVPAAEAEPAFAGSAHPDGGHHEDSSGVLHFWNTDSAPSMDHEFPSDKPI